MHCTVLNCTTSSAPDYSVPGAVVVAVSVSLLCLSSTSGVIRLGETDPEHSTALKAKQSMHRNPTTTSAQWVRSKHNTKLEWDEAVIPSWAQRYNRPNKQPPDYSASPDFFVGPIGLFEIWRSAINQLMTRLFIEQPRLHRVCQKSDRTIFLH